MSKAKISTKRKKSGTNSSKEHVAFKSETLRGSEVVTEALLERIKTNDLRSFRELLAAHLLTVNKMALAKKTGLGRRTIYDLIDPNKKFNPELSTISALIKALAV